MSYKTYRNLTRVQDQYNIMSLVGNGFDIQVLHSYGRAETTKYTDFYSHLRKKDLALANPIISEMSRLKAVNQTDWADIEARLADLSSECTTPKEIESLTVALDEVRQEFSSYLNDVVDSSLLSALDHDARQLKWGNNSLSLFLQDIKDPRDLAKVPFGGLKGFYDLYNFVFINFNYTSLLDNYLFLDSGQFDPRPHKTVDTNFTFNTNPNRLDATDNWNYASSSYLATDILHPHGHQHTPRSMLFGTSFDGSHQSPQMRLAKSYWSQAELKYGDLFGDTHLFIIFGCSLGSTDSWWWERIGDSLASETNSALMIYWRHEANEPRTAATVANNFMDAAGLQGKSDRSRALGKIVSVPYCDNDSRVWLSTRGATKRA